MTMVAGRIKDEIEEELRRQGELPEDYEALPDSEEADLDENPFGHLEKFYPKPDATDIQNLREWLQEFYRPLHEGYTLYPGNTEQREGTRYGGLIGLRKLRYGQDTTSAKLYKRLSNDVRVRSMQAHNLIFKVRSLLSRNPMQVSVPAESGNAQAIARSTKETRWANELSKAFGRRGTFNPFQESDDAQCEAFGGWVFFLRDAWDDIDMQPGEGDEDENGQPTKGYEERIGKEKRERGLPFGIRALDPLSTLIDPTDDGEGINAAIIVEKKRARPLLNKLAGRDTDLAERVKAGAFGGSGFDLSSDGEFETIQYWDACWYAYIVEGTVVTIEKHGLPGVPVFPAWGFITSARNMGDKFQGVAYALQMTEAIANDVLTQEVDARLTFNRVKLIGEADAGVSEPDETVLDIQGPEAKLLPPGFSLKDAFAGFRSNAVDPSIQMMLGLGAQQSAPSVMSGQSPSGDASGYSLNLLTQNAIGPYSALFENKANAWGNCVDFIRKTVKYTLKESVPLPIPQTGERGETTVEWLEIGPDEISDIPSIVQVDPTSDLEKIAISKWLLEGVAGDFVPPRILQEQGYGAKDASAWNEEIIRSKAQRMYGDQLVLLAYQELIQEIRATQEPPAVNMPNGQQRAQTDNPTGMPREARPSTVGASPGGTAGQMPSGQPTQQAQQFVGGPPA